MNITELMAKMSKGALSDAELKELNEYLQTNSALGEKAGKVIEDNKKLEAEKIKLNKLADDRGAEAKANADQLLKVNTSIRAAQVAKWLDARNDKDVLMTKLGTMSEEDFDLFKEGKTDNELKVKDDLQLTKAELEKLQKNPPKTDTKSKDDKLIPPGEFNVDKKEEKKTSSGFPTMDVIKEVYNLDEDNPLFKDKIPYMKRADAYINKSGRYFEKQ